MERVEQLLDQAPGVRSACHPPMLWSCRRSPTRCWSGLRHRVASTNDRGQNPAPVRVLLRAAHPTCWPRAAGLHHIRWKHPINRSPHC